MSGPRGIQLSSAQIIASVLATLTGAVAASYLGVAGTLIGAAVGSIASTMGTEIYKHYLLRSQERLRAAGQVLVQSAARTRTGDTMSQTGAGATRGGRHAASGSPASQEGATQDLADRDPAVWDHRRYGAPRDPHETQMIPGIPTQWNGTPSGSSNGGSGPGDTASLHAHGNVTGEDPAGEEAGRGGLWEAVTSFFGSLTRRQWLTYGGIAAGFFVVVIAAIIAFQLAVGRPPLGSSLAPTPRGSRRPRTRPARRRPRRAGPRRPARRPRPRVRRPRPRGPPPRVPPARRPHPRRCRRPPRARAAVPRPSPRPRRKLRRLSPARAH